MKKALKIIGIIVLVLVVLLIAAPFLFKGPIERAVKKSINNNINATVEWEDLSLSLFSSFPDAQLSLKNISVINKAPFAGDTLATSERLSLDMDIPQLFKGDDEPLSVNQLSLDKAYINVKVDSLGHANYDITKESGDSNTTTENDEGGLSLDVQKYEITDSRINYLDEQSKTFLRLTDFNHKGTGDFSADKSTLETQTDAVVSFQLDSVNYLNKNKIKLDADFEMDLANMKFTFLENKALINKLPLKFDGFVKINEDSNDIDLTFKTPSSDFKNFLAVIPETYSKNLDGVETSGDFAVNGSIKGVVDDKHIPKLDISVKSNNASFKYPDLPKKVQDITIDAVLKNDTGLIDDTYLNLDNLTFRIDQDVFAAKGNIKNLTGNMLVDLNAKGTLNLANLGKAYPIDLDMDLNGILKANMSAKFDMNSIEKEHYQNVKSNGTASITNFKYKSPEIPNDVNIAKARLNFNTSTVKLEEMNIKSGKTDADITGSLDNFMGYLFSDQVLKGRFNVKSNTFSLNDFMVAQAEDTSKGKDDNSREKPEATKGKTTGKEAIKIPSFLDAKLDFVANKVLYDKLVLKDVKGALAIKNETATLQHVTANIFGGNIGIDGNVSTKGSTPTFNMKLALKSIDIVESYNGMDLLKNLAPIIKALHGDLSTTIDLKGNLTNDLSPILSSLAGDAFAEILNAKVNTEETPLLAKLNNELNFLNLDKLNLNDLKANLTFDDGKINVKPFNFKIKDINIEAGGSHSFENTMNYTLNLDIPAKYLGSKLGSNLAKLSETDLENTKIDLPIGLTGSFNNPHIKLNTKAAVEQLTQEIIAKQKEKLKDKAEDKIRDLLNRGKDKNKDNQTESDNTKTVTDSTKTPSKPKTDKDKVKDKAKDILSGLFGKGKDKEKKDDKK